MAVKKNWTSNKTDCKYGAFFSHSYFKCFLVCHQDYFGVDLYLILNAGISNGMKAKREQERKKHCEAKCCSKIVKHERTTEMETGAQRFDSLIDNDHSVSFSLVWCFLFVVFPSC